MNRIFVIGVLMVVLSSCGGDNTSATSSNNLTESSVAGDTVVHAADSKIAVVAVDTPSFILEPDSLIGGYRFGMSIDQWNKNLAIHVNNGAPIELKQSGQILEGFTYIPELGLSNDNQQYGISTEGIFDFGYLIGVKFTFRVPQYILYNWAQNIIKEKGLKYLAGEEIPPIDGNNEKLYGFNYQIGQEYTAVSDIGDYLPNQEQEQSELKINVEKDKNNFVALYEVGNSYTVIESDIESSIVVTYDTRSSVYYDQNSGKKNKFYSHKIRDLRNKSIGYGDLIVKVYSHKQAKINPEDYYTFKQKEKLKKAQSNKEIIERVLNKSK